MSDDIGFQSFGTPLDAPIEIYADQHGVSAIFFNLGHRQRRPDRPNTLTRTAARQLQEYFDGKRREFELPLATLAKNSPTTEYRRKVWSALLDIPYGQTRTYNRDRRAGGWRPAIGRHRQRPQPALCRGALSPSGWKKKTVLEATVDR